MEPMPSEEFYCGVPGVRIFRLDWADTTHSAVRLWRAWFELWNTLNRRSLGEDANTWDADEARAAAPESKADLRRYAALEGHVLVGVSWFYRRPLDDPHSAGLVVSVVPEERGRGIGRALHDAMVMDAFEAGCTETYLETLDKAGIDDPLIDPARNDAIARAAGYRPYESSVCSVLPVPLPERFRQTAAEVARAGTPGYVVETCVGTPASDWFADLAELKTLVSTDVPVGEREAVREEWDVERVEGHYSWYEGQGKTIVVAVARELASGRLVGFTETSWTPAVSHFIHQGDTLVRDRHRGHGLGRAMKVAAIGRIVPLCPGARVQRTANGIANVHMCRINDELGYVRDYTVTSWDRPL